TSQALGNPIPTHRPIQSLVRKHCKQRIESPVVRVRRSLCWASWYRATLHAELGLWAAERATIQAASHTLSFFERRHCNKHSRCPRSTRGPPGSRRRPSARKQREGGRCQDGHNHMSK
ncbi:unnamed protein product, partial [Ectocarpus sp. 4 AP-2014]